MFKFLRKTALWILLAPAALYGAGALSNQVVLYVNHDTFPVRVNEAKLYEYSTAATAAAAEGNENAQAALVLLDHGYLDETHVIMTPQTHLNILADVFDLKDGIYSIGDFALMLSEWLFAFAPFVWAFEVSRRLSQQ